MTYANGDVYSGEWKDNSFVKGAVTTKLKDGRVYTGAWANGSVNGQGTLTQADGSTRTGNWKDGNFVS